MIKTCIEKAQRLTHNRAFVLAIFLAAFCSANSSEIFAQAQADLTVTKSGTEFVAAGTNFTYTITVSNFGPSPAINTSFTDTLPGDLTFVSLTQTVGPTYSCMTPAAGAGGTVTCTAAAFANQTVAEFRLTVNVPGGTPEGTSYTNIAAITSATFDPNDENNSFSATTTVVIPSAASVSVSGRVISANGRGIRGVPVRLIDEQGQHRIAMTTTFGYFRFADVPAGQSYTISVTAKKFIFTQPTQVLNLTGDTNEINFIAEN